MNLFEYFLEKTRIEKLIPVKKKELIFEIEHTNMDLTTFKEWALPIFEEFIHYLYYSNRMSSKGFMPSVTYDQNLEETNYKLDSIFRIKETDDEMDFTELTFYFKEEPLFNIFHKHKSITIKFLENRNNENSLYYSIGVYQPELSNLQISIAYTYFNKIKIILSNDKNEKLLKRTII
jgi:hypothetical protein